MKVLMIEPDTLLAKNYCLALESAGHAVDWQTSAQQAIQAMDQDKPDLIMLELQLPVHNGIEFLYELRSYTEWQKIPVVILSLIPRQTLGGIEYSLEMLGVVDYLYKPAAKLRHILKSVDGILQPAA